jgi:hypothetical protein
MTQPLALTDEQMAAVRDAAATLRLNARDKFLQALACELARCYNPTRPTDVDVRVAIRQILGVPTNAFNGAPQK